MSRIKPICQRFDASTATYHGARHGQFFALVQADVLPRESHSDFHAIQHGYAVGFGSWMFFGALEPAIAFGRAARMSMNCGSYQVRRAACETRHCLEHGLDEIALHLVGPNLDRQDDEVEILKRFVQSVKEHPWSSHWHEPTGFLVDYNDGEPAKTRAPSLPL